MSNNKFSFTLPSNLIAQAPSNPRDHSRLMVIDRRTGDLSHHHFYELPNLLKPTDVLVFNNSKVIPARLYGHKSNGGQSLPAGRQVEILLLRKLNNTDWEFISHPGLKPGQTVIFSSKFQAKIINNQVLKFVNHNSYLINRFGKMPLPPYIKPSRNESVLRRRYQNIYAKIPGSSAAPTAGLHFTKRVFNNLTINHVTMEYITLHVGLGTFKSPTPEQIKSGHLHPEYFTLDSATTSRLNQAKSAGRRIIAVGTTSCRVLESCADTHGILHPRSGDTDIFIKENYRFKFIDGLITNYHLPNTSLIMLVSAFASWPIIQHAYYEAIKRHYRFYSFGDSTLII